MTGQWEARDTKVSTVVASTASMESEFQSLMMWGKKEEKKKREEEKKREKKRERGKTMMPSHSFQFANLLDLLGKSCHEWQASQLL